MIMEVKKTQDLPSTGWRTRKAGVVIQSKSEGLRARKAEVQGQKVDVQAQAESEFTLPPPLCSVETSQAIG